MRHGTLAVLMAGGIAVSACTTEPPLKRPTEVVRAAPSLAHAASGTPVELSDGPEVSPLLAELNQSLSAAGAEVRVAKAELLVDPTSWDGTSLTLIADDRSRGIGIEWVAHDPRRNGRVGVTYAFDPRQGSSPITRNPDGSGLRAVPFSELDPILESAMSAWRNRTCSEAPITRVAVPANIDPDIADNLLLGSDGARSYSQVSDIVQAGWQPPVFFTRLAGASGSSIIGVTLTFIFVDANGVATDIDHDGNDDAALSEIYYNTRFAWGSTLAANVVDFHHILTHETGHSLGLAHFGKVFVTRTDAADGIQLADIKYAPKALMNAVYVTGRTPITGTDNSSFCQIWASKN